MDELKHISGPVLTRVAEFAPATIDVEARTVEVIASTGSMGTRSTWAGQYDEQLVMTPEAVKLDRLNTTGAVLDNHSAFGSVRNSVIGAVVPGSAKVDAGQLKATLRFAKTPAADEVFGMVQDRILRAVSVGYDPTYEEVRAKDRTDGGTLPLLRATSWEPYEISIVPMGFDPGAVVRSGEQRQTRTYAVMSRTEETKMETQAAPNPPAAPAVDELAIRRAAAKDAMTRSAEIRNAGLSFGLDMSALDEVLAQVDLSESDAVTRGKAMILDVRAKADAAARATHQIKPQGGHVEMTRDAGDKTMEAIGLGIMHRSLGAVDDSKVRNFNEKLKRDGKANEILAPLTDDSAKRFRRARLIDVAESFLQARGIQTGNMSTGQIAEAALSYRSGGSLMTTADFSGLLANTANKMLSIGYSEPTSPWRTIGIARRVDRPDFKTFTMYRRSGAPSLAKINEAGEIKRSGWGDSTGLTGQLSTAGVEVGFTRQMLINDDLEAFAQQSLGLGDSAIRWEDDSVMTDLLYGNATLSDGTAFFDASRGNLSTDVGAPDLTAIAYIGRMFAAMTETIKSPSTNTGTTTRKIQHQHRGYIAALTEYLGIKQILGLNNATTAAANVPAELRDLQIVRDDRLQVETSAPDVHFAFSDRPALVYGGLTGDPSPRLSMSSTLTSGVDGVLWQLIHDWYVAVEDPKAIIRIPKS